MPKRTRVGQEPDTCLKTGMNRGKAGRERSYGSRAARSISNRIMARTPPASPRPSFFATTRERPVNYPGLKAGAWR